MYYVYIMCSPAFTAGLNNLLCTTTLLTNSPAKLCRHYSLERGYIDVTILCAKVPGK